MKISTLFYCMWQGLRSTFRNKWFTLASVATISACLFLFGLFYAILMNFQHMVKNAQDGVSVTVFFDEGISDERVLEIGELISHRVEVSKVEYISADEAWETVKVYYFEGNEDAEKGFLENPLEESDSYEVFLTDVSMHEALVSYLKSIDGVRKVNEAASVSNMLSGINVIIGYVTGGIIVILFAVSVFLISNTVTIGISVRKEEIQIMKYIGATDFFVRAPFVIEGIIIGVIGSLIPLVVVYMIYNQVMLYVAERFTYLSQLMQFLTVEEIFANLTPVCIGLGVGIGFLGSFTTVRKHLSV
ncbi:MAG: permease-like cell division protein FtsX [Lachnospiraceae bacterium]|nr:permease-like cell division protein FtsX [Lachnospiraceae bacterium]